MKIVLASGVFDPLHYGHLLHFEAAKKLGDRLVVAVTEDAGVNKGDGRPVFKESQRAHMVRALRCVDQVLIVADSLDALESVQPDIFVKGKEYKGKIEKRHRTFCYENNIKIMFTDTEVHSSTKLLHYYESAGR